MQSEWRCSGCISDDLYVFFLETLLSRSWLNKSGNFSPLVIENLVERPISGGEVVLSQVTSWSNYGTTNSEPRHTKNVVRIRLWRYRWTETINSVAPVLDIEDECCWVSGWFPIKLPLTELLWHEYCIIIHGAEETKDDEVNEADNHYELKRSDQRDSQSHDVRIQLTIL